MVALAFLTLLSLVSVIPSSASTPTLGPWTETTDYGAASGSSGTGGVTVQSESCVTYGGYVYCVGGVVAGAYSSKTFFAQTTSSGVGGWTETTDYGAASGTTGGGGLAVGGESCVEYGGDVYCVGGYYYNPSTHKSGSVSNVYFAPLSASGIGAWTKTTDYGAASGSSGTGGVQVSYEPCVASGAYIYCIGGKDANFNGMSKVFYAQMSSTGIGAWTETTDYGASSGSSGSGGLATNPSCVAVFGSIVCIGGAVGGSGTSKVFGAALSSNGVGGWTETTDYGATSGSTGAGGVPIYGTSCAAINDSITCVGGYDQPTNAVYQGTATFNTGHVAVLGWPKGSNGYRDSIYNENCWIYEETELEVVFVCVGGNDPGVDLSAVWMSQVQGLTTTTTTSTTTVSSTVSTPTSASRSTASQATTTSSSGGGGGIPEFPGTSLAAVALTALVVVSYLLVRMRRS